MNKEFACIDMVNLLTFCRVIKFTSINSLRSRLKIVLIFKD